MLRIAVIVACAACGTKRDAPAERGSAAEASEGGRVDAPACTQLPFAATAAVPEASGAAWLDLEGTPALLVISDSGNAGAYAIVDAETGATRERGALPLGERGDDLEGIAARDGRWHVLTSPGWVRTYARAGAGFELVDGPYPLGPIDIAGKGGGLGDAPPAGTGMVCGATATNCGRNYEGLCLAPAGAGGACVGFAASKADGHLYCVTTADDGRLAVQHAPRIPIARPGVVADCAFAEDGRLFVGSNLFDAGNVYRVDGWQAPATAKVTLVAPLAIGFTETLAVRGEVFYRMSDTGVAPSMMARHRCPAPPR